MAPKLRAPRLVLTPAVPAGASELGVVKGIEALRAEFDVAAAIFVDRDLLE